MFLVWYQSSSFDTCPASNCRSRRYSPIPPFILDAIVTNRRSWFIDVICSSKNSDSMKSINWREREREQKQLIKKESLKRAVTSYMSVFAFMLSFVMNFINIIHNFNFQFQSILKSRLTINPLISYRHLDRNVIRK